MLNRVEIMGRLTSDPELRATNSGTFVTSFSIATDSDYKNPQGEKTTDFFDVIAWRNTAEFISKHFSKGRMIVVAGRLKTETWDDTSTGKKRKSTKIIAESVYFGDSKKDDGTAPGATYAPGAPVVQSGFTDISGVEEDDLPF